MEIANANATEWHLQLTQGGFALTEGQYYTVSFQAWGVQPRPITCNVSQAHASWANLGLSRRVNLGPQPKKFSLGFIATASDKDARITFTFGANSTAFYLAQVELHPGGQMGLVAGESTSAGNVSVFHENESTPRVLDRMVFLGETEKAYFDGMRSYIKKDLGCGALVTGTIVFGPLGLYAQSDMDYIDSHSYWEHPRFPGRPWDSTNWLIEQRPMTDHPDQATLFPLAAERLAGKPFTLSEYNHPAPLDAQAECVPMVASYAAAQDWDAIWLFDYASGSNDWSRQTMSGYFDMDTNPAKWGFMRAGAAIFRSENRSESRLQAGKTSSTRINAELQTALAAAKMQVKYGENMLHMLMEVGHVARETMLRTQILGWQISDASFTLQSRPIHPQLQFQWSADAAGRGLYHAGLGRGPGLYGPRTAVRGSDEGQHPHCLP